MVGKTVYWGNLKGEIKEEKIRYIHVLFVNDNYMYFSKDGRIYGNGDMPPVLSFTPYESPKLEKQIEKDTLVWCRQNKDDVWSARYYSHMEDGKHKCFINQLKSHQTKNTPGYWDIVQTESPFTHD